MSEYRFYIYHPSLKQPQRIADPVGWDSSMKTVEKDLRWHGVFFKYTPRLKFIRDGKALIQNFYESEGIESEVHLFVYKRKTSREYVQDYTGRLNLTPGSLVIGKIYLTCNIDQTGFIQKLKNRQEIKVNLQSLVSKGGKVIAAYDNETVSIPMHSKIIKRTFESKFQAGIAFTGEECDASRYLQLYGDTLVSQEIEEYFNPLNGSNTSIPVAAFKFKEAANITFNLRYELTKYRRTIHVDCVGSTAEYLEAGDNFEFYVKKNDQSPIAFTKADHTDVGTGRSSTSFSYTGAITFAAGDELTIYGDVTASLDDGGSIGVVDETSESLIVYGIDLSTPVQVPIKVGCGTIGWDLVNIDLEPPSGEDNPSFIHMVAETTFPVTNVPFLMMHEAFARVVESITDKADSFRSMYYGRTDSEPVTYDEDGEGCLKGISRALSVRGFPIDEYPIYATFKDLVKTAQAIDGVGIGVEKVDGVERVVVEDLLHFYNPEVGWTLNNIRGLEKSPTDEYFFNEVEVGFEKWSNEQINNLDEFCTKKEYELPITQVKNKLSLMSPYIGSGYTFEFLRRDGYTVSSTKDNDRDNDNVIVQMVRDGEGFAPAKDESFTEVNNLISPETSYNMEFQPMRNLKRNGRIIAGGLLKQLDKNINLAFGEGNTAITTQRTDETSLVGEQSIAISDLPAALWTGEVYTFKAKVTKQQFDQIEANLYKKGKVSENGRNHKYGWLLKMEPDKDGDTAFTILRANV